MEVRKPTLVEWFEFAADRIRTASGASPIPPWPPGRGIAWSIRARFV
jgi:hypothetical protein